MSRQTPGRATALGWTLCAALALPLPAAAQASQADERESLEALRQTTLQLIELLVNNGTLSRGHADALLAEARKRGAAAAQLPAEGWGKPLGGNAPATAGNTIRVPYVPQVVREQIRDELREDMLAVARLERWGVPESTPDWLRRISLSGDLRVRHQGERYDDLNPAPDYFLAAALGTGLTRVPDLAAGTSGGLATGNSQDNRERLRLRARLGFDVKLSSMVAGGIRLATGSASDRVSTNQTLGNNLNRYTLLLDRAFVKINPVEWASISAGRMPNPWMSTDLVWDDDLNFDGIAGTAYWPGHAPGSEKEWQPFVTAGYFPVREQSPPKRGRAITGLQLGVQWQANHATRLKVGAARYAFQRFEGQLDTDYNANTGAGRSYGQYEYEAALRQRGNTLFLTNSPYEIQYGLSIDRARWGLASKFRPWVLTGSAEFLHFAPYAVRVEGELVRNTGYSIDEVEQRSGTRFYDARVAGVGLKGSFGTATLRQSGDWQASLMLRWLGGDALPDAFVDSDLLLGGTNVKGFALGFDYAFARDSLLGLRYLSGRTIESPTARNWLDDRFGVDSLQVNVNVRF